MKQYQIIKLLEDCDCEMLQDHHLKLSDKPDSATDLKFKHKGHTFEGWYDPADDKISVVIFLTDADVDMYKENTCEKSEDALRKCLKDCSEDLANRA